MKPWILLLTAFLATPAASLAAEPPIRIALGVPKAQLQPGKASQITVELLGESGRPAVAAEPLKILLAGAAGLGAPAWVTVPAGASRLAVPIQAAKPGLWQIEARRKGLFPGFGVVVCPAVPRVGRSIGVKEMPPKDSKPVTPPAASTEVTVKKGSRQAFTFKPLAHIRPEVDVHRRALETAETAAPAPVPLPPPPRPEEARATGETASAAPVEVAGQPRTETASQGRVELIAHPTKVPRTRDGWESLVDAFWFEGDVPTVRSSPLEGFLVVEGGNSVRASSARILIPNGQFKAADSTKISAQSVDSAEVQALYQGGKSKPIKIDFLSPSPAQLALAGASRSFRGLTGVTSDILVRVLDDNGEPVAADREIPVDVAVEGPLGTRSYSAKVSPGAIQATVSLDLNRPGSYTVQASASGLKPSDPVDVRFALDWLLLASSLLGGVLGSLTRVLYRREHIWPRGFLRTVALGVAAALFVLLLSVFGVLSVLGDALPAAQALEKVPATSLFGALLLGFIAGLVFDKIFGRFLGARGGRKAKPPGGTPAPKEAPA
jgi:hypothetical protein